MTTTDMTTSKVTTSEDWDITPGTRLKRRDVQRRYGGNIQSGIAPSSKAPEVFLFSSPSGKQHGYEDGENADGTRTYTGEGQRGAQQMTRGNLAILTHAERGKHLRLFEGSGDGYVNYLGEYEYVTHEIKRIRASGTGELRDGIVFTLCPVAA